MLFSLTPDTHFQLPFSLMIFLHGDFPATVTLSVHKNTSFTCMLASVSEQMIEIQWHHCLNWIHIMSLIFKVMLLYFKMSDSWFTSVLYSSCDCSYCWVWEKAVQSSNKNAKMFYFLFVVTFFISLHNLREQRQKLLCRQRGSLSLLSPQQPCNRTGLFMTLVYWL